MSTIVLTDQKIWLAGYDLTGDMNALGLDYSAEMQDDTVFGDDTKSMKGGLKMVTASAEGFINTNTDQPLFDSIGVVDQPFSFAAESAEGSTAFTFKSVLSEFEPGGTVGEMFGFSSSAAASGSLVRGTLMTNRTETTTDDGTQRTLGAVVAGESLYAALHVTAVSGTNPTLDVVIESSATGSFAGEETTRITFTQADEITSEWSSVAGAITDTYWRVTWAIGGTDTPTFTFAVISGIL